MQSECETGKEPVEIMLDQKLFALSEMKDRNSKPVLHKLYYAISFATLDWIRAPALPLRSEIQSESLALHSDKTAIRDAVILTSSVLASLAHLHTSLTLAMPLIPS
jgi:hypothetical protein